MRAKGEGAFFQRSRDGAWVVEFIYEDEDGKRQKKTFTSKRQGVVAQKLAYFKMNLQAGRPVQRKGEVESTVYTYGADWLETVIKDNARPRSYESFKTILNKHVAPTDEKGLLLSAPYLGSVPLRKLTPMQVRTLLNHLKEKKGLSQATCGHVRTVLRSCLESALKDGLVDRNVAAMVRKPAVPDPVVRTFTEEQASAFLTAAADGPFELVYVIGMSLALRRNEILGLYWQNIDLKSRELHVIQSLNRIDKKLVVSTTTKTGVFKTLYINDAIIDAVERHRARQAALRLAAGASWIASDLVFTGQTGQPLEPVTLHRDFKRILRKAGLPDIPFKNATRHTCLSTMVNNGIGLKTVQEIAGHKSITTTAKFYVKTANAKHREAGEVMQRVLTAK